MNYGIEADPLTTLAGWYAIQGDRRAALEAIERVTKLIESWPPNTKAGIKSRLTFAWGELSDEQKVFELTDLASFYDADADLLMELHRQKPEERLNEAAFQATERARARTLLDLLRESRINLRADVAPALLQRKQVCSRRFFR